MEFYRKLLSGFAAQGYAPFQSEYLSKGLFMDAQQKAVDKGKSQQQVLIQQFMNLNYGQKMQFVQAWLLKNPQFFKNQDGMNMAPQGAAPRGVAESDDAPEEAAGKGKAPKGAAAKDKEPKEAAAKDAAPKEGAAKDAPAKEGAAKDAAPKEAAAKDEAPKDAAAQDNAPKDKEPVV
jgi:hypothetical protein